ncbi:hypothetical protein F0562_028731 [Nyssa sinensis]|uniref:Uncharacterized protein n=1 Tax=Nyssa sinensis TaxID=561372 RepID=A0A5J5AYZ1_9ASTE|nr:hypothetical protein F0562_028731 [Nyssa sinensis]
MPNMAYFEFLPHEPNSARLTRDSPPKLVDLADLKVGKEYELVITTYSGLNRYRVGDILRVTGFHNSAPQFHFVRRKNVLLSIDSDKTDESELQKAVENASELLREFNTSVVEYTSYADTKTIPGHYVIYWELLVKELANSPSDEVLSQCCLAMEESLNSVYRQGRVADNSIGPLEIRVVKNGTFEELMDYAISRGASINQYKVPRCVNFTPIMELLDSRVVSAHFSPSLPHWTPERRRGWGWGRGRGRAIGGGERERERERQRERERNREQGGRSSLMAALASLFSSSPLPLLPSQRPCRSPEIAFSSLRLTKNPRKLRTIKTPVFASSASSIDDLYSNNENSRSKKSVLLDLIQEIEPLDFQVLIEAFWEPLSGLLVSSMMTGYTLQNAEYRLFLERNLGIYEGNIEKQKTEDSKLEAQGMFLENEKIVRTSRENELPKSENMGEMETESFGIQGLGEITTEAQQYILNLRSRLSSVKKELHEVKRKTAALQMQQFVGEEKNDLLDYLRSLQPEKVAELSEPTCPELRETILPVVHGLLATLSPKMYSKAPLSENTSTGTVNVGTDEDCIDLVENTSLQFQPLISLTRDYLACLLFWCMLLGHYLRGLEYRLELMELVSLPNNGLKDLNSARKLFDGMPEKNMVCCWTSLIAGYAQLGQSEDVLRVFSSMVEENLRPEDDTMVSVLSACSNLKILHIEKWIRTLFKFIDNVDSKNVGLDSVNTILVYLYGKLGKIDRSKERFNEIVDSGKRSVLPWNAMINSYAQNGCPVEALSLFRLMMEDHNCRPNHVTMVSVLSACAQIGDLDCGMWVHEYMKSKGRKGILALNTNLATALIDMYSKCGSLEKAKEVFDQMIAKDVVSINAMIMGLAINGEGEEALRLFSKFQEFGLHPNAGTFLGVICACNHSGLLEKGRQIFLDMSQRFYVPPKLEHYSCYIDLLARVGCVEEAFEVVTSMPFEPNDFVWGALLGGCLLHNKSGLARYISKMLVEIDPENSAGYVMLSNALAVDHQWGDCLRVEVVYAGKGESQIDNVTAQTHPLSFCGSKLSHIAMDKLCVATMCDTCSGTTEAVPCG